MPRSKLMSRMGAKRRRLGGGGGAGAGESSASVTEDSQTSTWDSGAESSQQSQQYMTTASPLAALSNASLLSIASIADDGRSRSTTPATGAGAGPAEWDETSPSSLQKQLDRRDRRLRTSSALSEGSQRTGSSSGHVRRTYGSQRSFLVDASTLHHESSGLHPSLRNAESLEVQLPDGTRTVLRPSDLIQQPMPAVDEVSRQLGEEEQNVGTKRHRVPTGAAFDAMMDMDTTQAKPKARESYKDLLNKWGQGDLEEETKAFVSHGHCSDESVQVGKAHCGVMLDYQMELKTVTTLRSVGETRRFSDELEYLLSGLDPTLNVETRQSACWEIVSKVCPVSEGEAGEDESSPMAAMAESVTFLRNLQVAGKVQTIWKSLLSSGCGSGPEEDSSDYSGILDAVLAVYVCRVLTAEEQYAHELLGQHGAQVAELLMVMLAKTQTSDALADVANAAGAKLKKTVPHHARRAMRLKEQISAGARACHFFQSTLNDTSRFPSTSDLVALSLSIVLRSLDASQSEHLSHLRDEARPWPVIAAAHAHSKSARNDLSSRLLCRAGLEVLHAGACKADEVYIDLLQCEPFVCELLVNEAQAPHSGLPPFLVMPTLVLATIEHPEVCQELALGADREESLLRTLLRSIADDWSSGISLHAARASFFVLILITNILEACAGEKCDALAQIALQRLAPRLVAARRDWKQDDAATDETARMRGILFSLIGPVIALIVRGSPTYQTQYCDEIVSVHGDVNPKELLLEALRANASPLEEADREMTTATKEKIELLVQAIETNWHVQ